ncbi:MAG TPA: IPT/TIG domain-containing protein [Kofleriaceae bacterium]|nr:IPT/TIG domain-containing protein [Kofleriaceae bacterium]
MRTGKKFRSEIVALGALIFVGACVGDAPELTDVQPRTMSIGQTITLTGSRLCQQAGVTADGKCMNAVAGEVDFSVDQPVGATVMSWSDTTIVAVVPTNAMSGKTQVYVQSSGKVSNSLDITVLVP